MNAGQNFKRLPARIDTGPLLARLRAQPDLWGLDTLRETYPGSAHTAAASIMLRGPVVGPDDSWPVAMLRDVDVVDYSVVERLLPELREPVMGILDQIGTVGDLGRVMLTKLPDGGRIVQHVDEGLYADIYDRFHLCLTGGPGNLFRCGGEVYHAQPGDAFWFNHKREHSVENLTESGERIHLIVDVMAPEFRALRGVYFQREAMGDLIGEIQPLLEDHWREVAHYPDIPLDPAWNTYRGFEADGQLHCYSARENDELIGYVVFFVRPNHHYQGSLQAWQDVLFMDREHRVGMAGVRLIKYAERRLAAEGVQVVYHHAKRTNKVGGLLVRLGYELVDEIYAKRLDRKE